MISTGCSTSAREVNADPTLSKPAVITVGELRSAKLPKAEVIAVEEEPAHGVEDEAYSAIFLGSGWVLTTRFLIV